MATDEISVLREHLERFRGVTLQTLYLVSEEQLGWRPGEGLRSFGEQILHIAQTEDFYTNGFFGGKWETERFAAPGEPLTRHGLRRRLDQTRQALLAELGRLEPRRLEAMVAVPNVPTEWPLRSWLWYLVEHEVHHKSQLALYLRRMGLLPPFFAAALPPGFRPDIR